MTTRTHFIAALLTLAALCTVPLPVSAQCGGDCNGDGAVSISELIRGVNVALGRGALSECEAADANSDGSVRVTDLIVAVNAALSGCPPVPTTTPTATATATSTATVNQTPAVEVSSVYRSFPNEEIVLPVIATDPERGPVECAASDLPDGASFDAEASVLSWTPSSEQVGAYEIGLQCTDEGGAIGRAALPLRIAPRTACSIATCDPASGCETEPLSIDENCCDGEPDVRVPEPAAPCPAGRLLRIGRNERGFGRIDNCHLFRMLTFGQGGSHTLFNIEARCIDIDGNVRLSTRLETATRILADSAQFLDALEEREDGYVEQRGVFVVLASIDPSALEGEEAQFTLRLTDASGAVVEHVQRVVLTAGTLPNLPELQ